MYSLCKGRLIRVENLMKESLPLSRDIRIPRSQIYIKHREEEEKKEATYKDVRD